ncbi:MAG: hypothetical protein O3B65_01975 [Chloroflexi bacterium]|nr:hypothetical protein [Chloroflexota bacterium]
MSREMIAPAFLRRRLLVVGVAMLLGMALTVVFQPVFTASGSPAEAPESQSLPQGTGVVFQVHPTIVKFPPSRIRDAGIWLIGAGLKADQEVVVRMVWGSEELTTDLTSVIEYIDEDRGGIFANVHGAFAVAFERGFRSPDQDFVFYQQYEPVSLRLLDAVTGEVLAVAPMVVCGPLEEEPWCNAASDLLPIE